MSGKSKVQSIDYYGFWTYGSVGIVKRGVNHVLSREGICWGHLGPWHDLPDDVKVL